MFGVSYYNIYVYFFKVYFDQNKLLVLLVRQLECLGQMQPSPQRVHTRKRFMTPLILKSPQSLHSGNSFVSEEKDLHPPFCSVRFSPQFVSAASFIFSILFIFSFFHFFSTQTLLTNSTYFFPG